MSKGALDISILGLPALEQMFRTLPVTLQSKCLRPALRAAAKDLKAAVQAAAPRASGRMAASFGIRARKRSRTGIGIDVVTGTRAELGIPVNRKDGGPRGYYPAAVEFGTKKARPRAARRMARLRARFGNNLSASQVEFGTRTQPPRPFIRPTVDRLRGALIQKIGAVLSERVNAIKSVTRETEVFGAGGGGLDGEVLA